MFFCFSHRDIKKTKNGKHRLLMTSLHENHEDVTSAQKLCWVCVFLRRLGDKMPLNLKSWSQQNACRCVRARVAVTYNHVRVFCLRVCDSENRMSGCVIFLPPTPSQGLKVYRGREMRVTLSSALLHRARESACFFSFFFLGVYVVFLNVPTLLMFSWFHVSLIRHQLVHIDSTTNWLHKEVGGTREVSEKRLLSAVL